MKKIKILLKLLESITSDVNRKKWYHVTDSSNVDRIKKQGFKISHNSIFGAGVYFSGKKAKLRQGQAEIEAKVNLKNILKTKYIEYPKLYQKLTDKKHSGISGEEQPIIKLGYDGIYIVDEDWLVVFDPKKIKIK